MENAFTLPAPCDPLPERFSLFLNKEIMEYQ